MIWNRAKQNIRIFLKAKEKTNYKQVQNPRLDHIIRPIKIKFLDLPIILNKSTNKKIHLRGKLRTIYKIIRKQKKFIQAITPKAKRAQNIKKTVEDP